MPDTLATVGALRVPPLNIYRFTPPRPLEEIEAGIRGIEQDILGMLAEVTGGEGG